MITIPFETAAKMTIEQLEKSELPKISFLMAELSFNGYNLNVEYNCDELYIRSSNSISSSDRIEDHLELVTDKDNENVIAWGYIEKAEMEIQYPSWYRGVRK